MPTCLCSAILVPRASVSFGHVAGETQGAIRQRVALCIYFVLYCASLHDVRRVHVHNKRKFSQVKLDSQINARFFSNERGDLYFSFHTKLYILTSDLKKKFIRRKKKRYRWKRAQHRYSGMQIMTAKTTTLRTPYVHVVLNSVSTKLTWYIFVLYALRFLPVKFFSSINLINYISS